jgi:glycine oxidase
LLLDDEASAPNASAVAAGMVAPAAEAAFDEAASGRLALLRAAAELWAETVSPSHLVRCGSMVVGLDDDAFALEQGAEALEREGARVQRLTAAEARRMVPQLSPELTGAVLVEEDARLDVSAALAAMEGVFLAGGGQRRRRRVDASDLAEQRPPVVICAGWGSRALESAAPELGALQPIKGQLIRLPGAAPFDGPILRHGGVYLAPSAAGVVAGASMHKGASDLAPSDEVAADLARAARAVLPHLRGTEPVSAVGVRAATPDGLPLVGRSRSGVHLATGFRRNGWLLAPLAARIVADQLTGQDPGPWAQLMRPGRFN